MEKSEAPNNINADKKDYIVEDIDPYNETVADYRPNYLGIKKLGPVMIICGQS